MGKYIYMIIVVCQMFYANNIETCCVGYDFLKYIITRSPVVWVRTRDAQQLFSLTDVDTLRL